MSVIETRLAGRHATLAGITRMLNRQIGRQPVSRIELRYSTQAAEPLQPPAAKLAVGELLRELGLGNVAVSIRAHAGALDDASGEHVLRVFADAAPAATRPAWWAWLGAQFDRWRGRPVADAAPPAPAALSRRDAVAQLRQAVAIGALPWLAGPQTAPVHRVEVTVRLTALHQVLEPLIAGDLHQAARSIAPMLQAAGVSCAATMQVHYTCRPRASADGTAYASEDDLEVRLQTAPPTAAALAAGNGPTALPGLAGVADSAAATLLPAKPQVGSLRVRVLGTTTERFAQPFELFVERVPAQLDRRALAQAGLADRHPELLAVASNSCPLRIEAAADGRWELLAGVRHTDAGETLPMYYDAATRAPLPERLMLTPGQAQEVLVNGPAGVLDTVSGRLLPALHLELECRARV